MKIVCPVCGKWKDNWKREVEDEPVDIAWSSEMKRIEYRVCKSCGHKEVVNVTKYNPIWG